MTPSSVPKASRAAGFNAANATSKATSAQAAYNLARVGAGGQPVSSNTNAQTTAQLVPNPGPASSATPVTEANGSLEFQYVGMPQPDDVPSTEQPGQPYKDGRIRNPVPSKLKGKTSNSSGSFSVMHMDIKGKDLPTDRDAAAKRTSESTALAAKMAFQNGYQPHRKSNWMRIPEETPEPGVPFTGTTPYDHTLYGLKQPAPVSTRETTATPVAAAATVANDSHPLSPNETKEQQARLLTLLRTLQPVAVVDQLCKALAYFGGVPEAPPPLDGRFPESAEANGSGAIFVGWVAEIFPDLDAQGRRKPRPIRVPQPAAAVAAVAAVVQSVEKRGRGRPKGSKASKFRSDKGVKKGPKKASATGGTEAEGAENDDSWVDLDDTVVGKDHEPVIMGEQARQQPPDHQDPPNEVDLTPSAKKRGRPKGSKVKTKDGNVVTENDLGSNPQPISAMFSIGKKTGRAKGSKARAKETTDNNSVATAAAGAIEASATESQTAATVVPQQQGDPEFALAALQAFNESHAHETGQTQPGSFQPVNACAPSLPAASGSQQVKGKKTGVAKSGEKGQPVKKRKRIAKDTETTQSQVTAGNVPAASDTVSDNLIQSQINAAEEPAMVESTVPAVPAPKRQRKSKAKSAANTRAEAAPVLESNTAATMPQTTQSLVPPAPVAQPPTDTQVYTSPTIEELEAQLDHHDEQNFRTSVDTNMRAPSSQARPSQPEVAHPQPQPLLQPQPQPQQVQIQQTQQAKAAQSSQQIGDQQQRQAAIARQRQQYHQQQQQQAQQQAQQQVVARTASPSVNNIGTASPHLSVQSTSPSINPAHSASPSLHQQQISNSQTPTSVASKIQSQQARNSQAYYAQSNTPTQSQFSQQQAQQYANPQPKQQQQQKQQYSIQQAQQQQNYSTQSPSQQPQSFSTQQSPPQYSQQKQQSYSTQQPQQPQQQFNPQPQQYSSQQRVQPQPHPQPQYTAASAATSSQSLASQSPHFGTSTTPAYNSNDGTFRAGSSAGMSFGNSTYAPTQSPTAPRSNNLFPSTTNSYSSPNQEISSYATSRRPLPTSTPQQAPVQNVQSIPQNIGGFSDFGNLGFDMASLDNSAASHSSLGLGSAPYNIGAGNASGRSAAGAANFSPLNSFDSTLRNDAYSNYGLPGRR